LVCERVDEFPKSIVTVTLIHQTVTILNRVYSVVQNLHTTSATMIIAELRRIYSYPLIVSQTKTVFLLVEHL